MSEPLTDEQMDEMQRKWGTGTVSVESVYRDVCDLISEVRRLRSDEWLEKAAEEIGGISALAGATERALAILRKHRDAR